MQARMPHADFDPDRALVNYNVIDGDVLILKEVLEKWGKDVVKYHIGILYMMPKADKAND